MENENIQRVDNRPASIYSMVVFILVFTVFYIFYPQISMYIPFAGENITFDTEYAETGALDMADVPVIVTAKCIEKGKTESFSDNSVSVYKQVKFETLATVKGGAGESFILKEWGGSVLLNNGETRKKKYNVSYENSAEFEIGETYLLFINLNGEVVNGKYGAIKANSDGTFTDAKGKTYSAETLKDALGGEKQ